MDWPWLKLAGEAKSICNAPCVCKIAKGNDPMKKSGDWSGLPGYLQVQTNVTPFNWREEISCIHTRIENIFKSESKGGYII